MSALSVEEAIGLYVPDLHRRGFAASSCATAATVLRSCFSDHLADSLTSMTPAKAQAVINGLGHRISRHTRRPLRKVTRRKYEGQARLFFAWCASRELLPINPLQPAADDAATVG
jgi:hypothetical protein